MHKLILRMYIEGRRLAGFFKFKASTNWKSQLQFSEIPPQLSIATKVITSNFLIMNFDDDDEFTSFVPARFGNNPYIDCTDDNEDVDIAAAKVLAELFAFSEQSTCKSR